MNQDIQPILVLYSHSRNPPLHPSPDLRYDLRSIPNPPKALRDVSDGRSKRIREHLLSEAMFVSKLESVEQEILSGMNSKIAEYISPHNADDGHVQDDKHTLPLKDRVEDDTDRLDISNTMPEGTSIEEIILRVGCNCALGHHRSVAFVCELASRPWPKNWEINVIHRDLEQKRSAGARSRQKASWKDNSRRNRIEDDQAFD